ncbi:MAG: hypothetical protein KAS23_03750, partial [Anaerohalosphaera sp.]|nr:hypothetical protein [Anaerohalosphaera sp.]
MEKRLFTLVCLLLTTAAVTAGEPAKEDKAAKIREGFVFSGTEGTVSRMAETDRWFFESHQDAVNGEETVKAGRKIEMLACSTLEGITAGKKKNETIAVKLWAKVTMYSNLYSRERLTAKKDTDKQTVVTNYLFAVYYLPIAQTEDDSESEDNDEK